MSTSIESLPNDEQMPLMNSNTSTNTGSTPINFSDMSESEYTQTDASDYESDHSSQSISRGSGINQAYNTRQNEHSVKPRESPSYMNSKRNAPVKKTVKIKDEPEYLSDVETIQTLPSRDIPINPLPLNSDQEVVPSFMKQESQKDYIRDFESIEELKEKAKKEEEELNTYEKYFTYFLVSLLYVFLQLPVIKIIFRYNLPKLFSEEGIPKFTYHILMALILGIMFFVIDTYVLKEIKIKELINF
jgi:hypothetical protein